MRISRSARALWAENHPQKEALCARVEALAESTDWERRGRGAAAAGGMAGHRPGAKSRSEAIWQRFREACDRFFTRYAHRHDVARAERVAAREAICAELERYSPASPRHELRRQEPLRPPTPRRAVPWRRRRADAAGNRARAHGTASAGASDRGAVRGRVRAVLARWPAAFGGSDLDPEANRRRMESLVRRDGGTGHIPPVRRSAADDAMSPTARLAAMLKEALAANTIGGKVDDDSRWRAAAEEVRQAQESWSRIGLVPDAVRRRLPERFQRAIRRITEGAAAGRQAGAGRRRAGRRAPGRRAGQARRLLPARPRLRPASYLILISSTSNTSSAEGGLLPL